MNFKQIRGFLELSKTLNFSRTAKTLYMSQPAFSRMIESLEKELGTKLIQRDKVNPKLTTAGQKLLPRFERLLDEYTDLLEETKRFSENKSTLTIGLLEDGIRASRTGQLIRNFLKENPSINVDFVNTSESEAFDQIVAGKMDCAILVHFPEIYKEKLIGTVISWDRDCVFMNRNNPLASKEIVSVRDLKTEGFIVVGEAQSRFGFNRTMSLCLQHGFSPHIAKTTSSVNTALLEVDMNYGVMILHSSMKEVAGSETVAIPLEDEPYLPVRCIQRKDNANPAMTTFREFIAAAVNQNEPDEIITKLTIENESAMTM